MLLLPLILLSSGVLGYNVDDQNPKIFQSPSLGKKNYFGYSIAVYAYNGDTVVFVGAPRGNSSFFPEIFEPGTIFRCSSKNGSCDEWLVDSIAREPKLSKFERQVKDQGWLGASMDVHQAVEGGNADERTVVVCAPRWRKEKMWGNKRTYMNGMCFSKGLSNLSNDKRYFPLSNPESEIVQINGINYYDHGMGVAGFSINCPRTSRFEFAVGAPGAAVWTGSSLFLGTTRDNTRSDQLIALIPDILHDARFEKGDFFGYSITSGRFYTPIEDLFYAAGAPRSSQNKGKVFVYQFPSISNRKLIVKDILEGDQYGEYFGSSLTSCDINNDGRDDLVIGSPFWSRVSDEGRVQVYASRHTGSFDVQKITAGEFEEPGARFGSTLSCLGDLDHDGYADVAVAAPYEDQNRGVVYIFQGSIDGLNQRFSQRIPAAQFGTNLRGFGQAIGKDQIGTNIAVGAYLSGHVVLMTTRPVVVLSLRLRNSDENYSLWTNKTFVPLQLCASYKGPDGPYKTPKLINVSYTVEVDKFHHRTFIYDKIPYGDTYRRGDTLSWGRESCINIKTYIKKNLQNVVDPIEVKAQVNLTDSTCPNCPVINPELSNTVVDLKLAFLLDCGEDSVCVSDLRVSNVTSSDLLGFDNDRRFIIGSKPSVNVSVDIDNVGEPAYRAQAHVYVPQPIAFARIPPECNEQVQIINRTIELICNIGNPLRGGYKLLLELDMSGIVYTEDAQEIQIVLTTQSQEKHFLDNIFTFLINYDVDADIGIVGKSYDESYTFFEQSKYSFDHVYEIQKFGKTPIEEALFTLNVPTHWKNREILRIRHVQGYMEGRRLHCENIVNVDSKYDLFSPNKTLFYEGENPLTIPLDTQTFYVNCTDRDIVCQTFHCVLGPFIKKNSVATLTVSIELQLFNDTVKAMKRKDVLFLVSEAFVRITQPNITFDSVNKKPDFKQISTIFKHRIEHSTSVPLWIIILSVLLGIVLTTLLTLLLMKLGFFNRKVKDDLDALKSTDEINPVVDDNEKY